MVKFSVKNIHKRSNNEELRHSGQIMQCQTLFVRGELRFAISSLSAQSYMVAESPITTKTKKLVT